MDSPRFVCFINRLVLPVLFLPIIGCAVLMTVGCPGNPGSSPARFHVSAGSSSEQAQRDREVFERSFAILNSMQDYPDLEGLPGYETMIQTLDRFNRWIKQREPDPKWKPEPMLEELEKLSRSVAGKVRTVLELLQTLQGTGETAEARKTLPAEERTKAVQEDRVRLGTTLDELDVELRSLAGKSGIPFFAAYAGQISALRQKFRSLDSMPNVQEGVVRAFVQQQLAEERQNLQGVARALESFAETVPSASLLFHKYDIDYLKQSVWMRNISNWARGDKQGSLNRAKALFDWTARNIDLRDELVRIDNQRAVPAALQMPWQTLLLGSGTAWDRAWVFMELLRQQRIDCCLLGNRLPKETVPGAPPAVANGEADRVVFWGIGVLIDGNVHLFFIHEGVPIPGKSGPVTGEKKVLEFPEIATLSDLIAEPELLNRTMTGDDKPFASGEMLRQTIAALPVTPGSAAMRMKILETELAGEQTMVLYTPPHELRDRFGRCEGIASVEIWQHPYRAFFETANAPQRVGEMMAPFHIQSAKTGEYSLWKGRILYFQGRLSGPISAATCFMDAMTPDRLIQDQMARQQAHEKVITETIYRLVNSWAGYWLGLAAEQEEKWEPAREFFVEKSAIGARTSWNRGVPYNLGRINEAEGKYEEAVRLYTLSNNRLRAKWLKESSENRSRENR